MTVKEALVHYPAPWRYQIHAGNLVRLLDANGNEVPMFVMLDFVTLVTSSMAASNT